MTIVFIGDIHRQWHQVERGLDALEELPTAAMLLGDMQCERPLDELAAPLLDRGIAVYWIFGNHDNDGGPEMWANLVDPERNPRTAPGALHAGWWTSTACASPAWAGRSGRVSGNRRSRRACTGATICPHDLAKPGPHWRADHQRRAGPFARGDRDLAGRLRLSGNASAPTSGHARSPAQPSRGQCGARRSGPRDGRAADRARPSPRPYRAVAPDGLRAMGVAAAWG